MKEEEEFRGSWMDVLAAILAVFESLIIPFVLLVAALVLVIVLFKIVFS